MRHALVTGASGFIGRELCEVLRARGVKVCALQRECTAGRWDDCVAVDLARGSPEPARLAGIDTVFHLAGHAHAQGNDEALHQAVTVHGTRHLLAACGEQVQRIVFASSVKAMAEDTPAGCLDEDSPASPQSAYGRARRDAEQLLLAAAPRLHTAVVRLPLVYGPGVRGNLDAMLRAVAAARMPLLPDFANRRSLVHVRDACEALVAAALTPAARGRVYLVTDGQCYSSRQIQDLMYAACGRAPPRLGVPRAALRLAAVAGDLLYVLGLAHVPFDSPRLQRLAGHACFDCSRARRELGYAPQHELADALPSMFAALDAHAS